MWHIVFSVGQAYDVFRLQKILYHSVLGQTKMIIIYLAWTVFRLLLEWLTSTSMHLSVCSRSATLKASTAMRIGWMKQLGHRMADCCPALKEFVWYVGQLAEKDKPVSWQWKIYRKDNGAVNWIQGSLYWPASCRPVFPSFREWALVGQERTSMEKYKWPRTAIWP
ncbi:hypothetical protein BDP27DRAFT_1320394 [Rhodocollybia butyracea]|uniref:Uncharacterized protein n=1 Tax=Rhodocollybia butyracea TaxID=206335 RepID=A0A9P5Q2I4_9AGAR|nr:hypothetical protein BDP27DRAFT_1320394 [Rhodocollybia butyracea]